MRRVHLIICLIGLIPLACGGGSSSGGGGGGGGEGAPLVLAAGMVGLDPDPDADWTGGVDTSHLWVKEYDTVYDLTTPRGEDFSFDLLTRARGNSGPVRVSMAHVLDGDEFPSGGVETLAEAGLVPSATGTANRNVWLDAHGDGFARITVRGKIERDQVIAVETEDGNRKSTAVVRIRIGPESEINQAAVTGGDYSGVENTKTLYSSNSWMFGLPTIAVSGDRTSIVCYEGDRGMARNGTRFEMRLQHEAASGLVTGGGSFESSPDSGHWRDHEVAALYNVLALVNSGGELGVRLSFDRGATFAQTVVLDRAPGDYRARLVNLAMAADYTLGVAWWRSHRDGSTDLVLAEGRPSAYDEFKSPTEFEFDDPVVVYHDRSDVTPLIFSLAWSTGGDLVIGYAFTRFTSNRDGTWTSLTQNRCAVRLYGAEFKDILVEEDKIVGRDPSVSLVGEGSGMRVFYAYESRTGVRLRVSDDAGKTFSDPVRIGDRSGSSPTVIARDQDGALRVDVVYLASGAHGMELHLRHWDDWAGGISGEFRLTDSKMVESATLPRDGKVPGADVGTFVPDRGYRITEISWFGYDAVLDGDDVVVVYDEVTYDAWTICYGAPFMELDGGAPRPYLMGDAGEFQAAEPPPLAPGMTEPVPPPDPEDMHQLKLLRID